MPHRDFDAARLAYAANQAQRDPITFDLAGEVFTVPFEPTIGDTFDLAEVPDVSFDEFDSAPKATQLLLLKTLRAFIRRALPVDDRPRMDAAWYRIPMTEQAVIIQIAEWIVEQWTGFPTGPPVVSSIGRRANGATSKRSTGGKGRSR